MKVRPPGRSTYTTSFLWKEKSFKDVFLCSSSMRWLELRGLEHLHGLCHVSCWLARRKADEDPGEVKEAWRLSLTYLQAYLGATIKNPMKRDESFRASDNVTTMVYRRHLQSKMEWHGLYENCFILLHYWFVILHEKMNGDSFLAKCRVAFGQGFIDLEEIVRGIEASVANPTTNATQEVFVVGCKALGPALTAARTPLGSSAALPSTHMTRPRTH
jgi:hypothetical protein